VPRNPAGPRPGPPPGRAGPQAARGPPPPAAWSLHPELVVLDEADTMPDMGF